MLLVFRATSNQRRLAAVKRSIHASLFEMRLFNDDVRALFRAQAEILRHNVTYILLTLIPMAWMIVPLTLLVAHLQAHYGYDPLAPGDAAVLRVQFGDGWEGSAAPGAGPALAVEAPPGVRVETPAVWIPSLGEAAWRIRAAAPGRYDLNIRVGDTTVTKTVRVGDAVARRSAVRPDEGLLAQTLYPAEPPVPDGPVRSINLGYRERSITMLGFEMHWIVAFFVLTMIFAFALRKPLGVVI
jgi:hypothetical protein